MVQSQMPARTTPTIVDPIFLNRELVFERAQPRDHISEFCLSTLYTFAALITLPTTTHNPTEAKYHQISFLADKHLHTFLLHLSYSGYRMYSHMVGRPV